MEERPPNEDPVPNKVFGDILTAIGGYKEEQYLKFLREKAAATILDEIARDGLHHFDSSAVAASDILDSLRKGRFCTPVNTDVHWITGELAWNYAVAPEESGTFTIMYVASLYLHLNAIDATYAHSQLSAATFALVRGAMNLDCAARLHVVKFLLHLQLTVPTERHEYDSQLFHSLSASLLLGSLWSDTSAATYRQWKEGAIGLNLFGPPVGWKALVDEVVGELGGVEIGADMLRQIYDRSSTN